MEKSFSELSNKEKEIIYNLCSKSQYSSEEKEEEREKIIIDCINNDIRETYDIKENREYFEKIIEKLVYNFKKCITRSELRLICANNEKKCIIILNSLMRVGLVKENVDRELSLYLIDEDCIENLNFIVTKINIYLKSLEKLPKIFEDIDSSIEKWKKDFECEDTDYDIKKITNNKEKLLEYIKNIVNLDSDIFSLKRRYEILADEYKDLVKNDYFLELAKINESSNKELNKIDDEIKKINDLIMNKPIFNEKIEIKLPTKPIFNISKPEQPVLKTPNIFNRKKVEEENKKTLQEYNDDIENYNKEYEKFTNALSDYENKVKELTEMANKQNEELYQNELEKYNSKVIEYKDTLAQKKKEKQELETNIDKENEKQLEKTDIYKKVKSIEYEINFIVENIKKDIELKNKLYSYNVIYGKYRNYIAMSSFIDYLSSGRCDTLDTSTGAYNLYEQESRTDIIINKMDTIINSLEKIKENQYYIYNQLNNINQSLDIINGQLLVSNILQVVQISQLETMIEKADEIAYNTKVTAYYAKKTANYTKALTFINLLDRL